MAGPETLKIQVVTPEGAIFKGIGSFVAAPAINGEMGIMPRHTALIARLGAGILRITEEGLGEPVLLRYAVRGGFLQVVRNEVTLLVGEAAKKEDLDPGVLKTERVELLARLQHPGSDEDYEELLAARRWLEASENLVA